MCPDSAVVLKGCKGLGDLAVGQAIYHTVSLDSTKNNPHLGISKSYDLAAYR